MISKDKIYYLLIRIPLVGFSYDNTKNIFFKKFNIIPNGLNKNILESTSNELFSGQFYNYLNNIDNLLEYYEDCSSLVSISSRSNKGSLRILCAQLLKYLKTTYTTLKIKELTYDPCILLNYWVYNRLVNIFGSDVPSTIAPTFATLQQIWNSFVEKQSDKSFYNKCIPNDKIIMQSDWKKRKELYDYYVDYDTLYKTARDYSQKCEAYYFKIKEMISVYKYFEEKCSSDKYKCPDVFYKCREINLQSELEKLPCHETIKGRTVSTSEDRSFRHSPGSEGRTQDLATEAGTQLENGDSGIGTKLTNSVLGAAPVLLTATALYRVCIYFINIYQCSMNL
ncbi:hypothetical protein PVBG_05914 [Plasmodium vivax Brazil I]|uniref:Variable surface protein Vir4 n=1 Tax=Plasmodium vivax (strain Brazil I) TaxID=1033975 RepID=A0A0J9VQ42_PLAV1|nr:hypothetical protein PVBG_05914 [Plasmodium vivax Brazil I]